MGLGAPCVSPQQDGRYSATELRLLAAALGFPGDTFQSQVPSGSLDREGIRSKDLRRLLVLGTFTSSLHFTYNMKSGLYNIKVVDKCLDLLEQNVLRFADIQDARVAFCAYEPLDQRGVQSQPRTLLKVMKMCGFAVSPERLSRHLKQNRPRYVEQGRIQLYEFLDLLLLCEPRMSFSIKEERVGSTDKTSRGLYQMDNMRSLTVTPDEKLERHLDRRFQLRDSWLLPQGTTGTSNHLASGKHQQTPNPNRTRTQPPLREIKGPEVTGSGEPWTMVTPVPHPRCRCYTPKPVDPILSEQDLQATQNDVEDVRYQMETMGERSQWELNWKLDYYLPGYRERAASRQKPVLLETPGPVTQERSEPDVFERLSAPRTRMPSPIHALVCDARKLGITHMTRRHPPTSGRKKSHSHQGPKGRS
ncbi:uncharacterized protein O3C94_019924 [Discoglossus pictus]